MKQYADIARLLGAFMRKICLLKRVRFRLRLANYMLVLPVIERARLSFFISRQEKRKSRSFGIDIQRNKW